MSCHHRHRPPLLQLSVPVVLDIVIGSARQLRSYNGPPASDVVVETANDVVLFLGETSVLDVGPEVIEPPQAAAFAATFET